MKNFLIFLTVLLLSISTQTYSQDSNWVIQNSGTNEELMKVQFTDINNGWVVGTNGTILHTSDGGINWVKQNSGNTTFLNNLFFINQNQGWVVGDFGLVLMTTNSGNNWELQNTGTIKCILGISFVDQNTGWAVGENGIILKTINGGKDWIVTDTGYINNHLWNVHFVDKKNGWAVGENGRIIATSDSGKNWTNQYCITQNRLLRVRFIDEKNGYIGGFGYIFTTNDGGNTWNYKWGSPMIAILDIQFLNLKYGWAVSDKGDVFITKDGGETWDWQAPVNTRLHGVSCIDSNNVWIVGYNGKILHSKTSGTSVLNYNLYTESIHISPNPASDYITINTGKFVYSPSAIEIYNVLGEKVISKNFAPVSFGNSQSIDISGLNSGLYYCAIITKRGRIVEKFAVIR